MHRMCLLSVSACSLFCVCVCVCVYTRRSAGISGFVIWVLREIFRVVGVGVSNCDKLLCSSRLEGKPEAALRANGLELLSSLTHSCIQFLEREGGEQSMKLCSDVSI